MLERNSKRLWDRIFTGHFRNNLLLAFVATAAFLMPSLSGVIAGAASKWYLFFGGIFFYYILLTLYSFNTSGKILLLTIPFQLLLKVE